MAFLARSTLRLRATSRFPVAARTLTTSPHLRAAAKPYFADEPSAPKVVTAIPGPKNKAATAELDKVFDVRSLNMLTDYTKSIGNYCVISSYAQIASIPVASSPEMVTALINRPALGNFPSADWAHVLNTGILKVAPKGLDQVFTAMAGSDANETAYKAAFMYYRQQQRGGPQAEFTAEEIETTMNNHLSTTRSKAIHKMDIPAFDWPQAPFPSLKYPLEEHAQENAQEEQRCLQEVERLIKEFHNPVAAVVVEPIQSEGGDNHASPAFFQGLRDITKRNNVLFIVDEVQTGVGATGKFWAHDHWNLQTPPDIVTFSKKAQTAGYYYGNPALRPNKPYRQFNTWMGDPARALIFRGIIEEIERLKLVENTAATGDYLFAGLERLAKQYPEHLQNLRGKGQGTFIAWDTPKRDEFLAKAKGVGVNIGGSGMSAVRLRPMLIFQKHHADILLESVEKIIKQL
ncbi:4-aminobutyrate transaminase gatA [Aspergillus novofumigatus IBT 16806]|uniref:4-aminobutyrate transaminase gata n=1 Tax=Aspergillus novofumigatus (strain IBT 16806) TaxID=1392255 RepID=A0A2I1CGW3_ASPN1|nr:4-aminobutyrate transaminase gata [Aspergillus novofumigatus IBT 16806]PKX96867.1 4-aminobutyrate transaminase gata [Aspergillus novofumigatus IBT 16806]